MEQQEQDRLYIDLKKKICGLIYKGTYQEGEKIPPERVLAEEFGVSRITVRKTLALLEKEGLVIREIGRGTTVCFQNKGAKGSLDMTALVAPARGTFFSRFIEYFQRHLDENDVLLLYVQKPEKESIESCLYRLYSKDIRNVVVWPDDAVIDKESLRKLRALGMNMVFFDTDAAVPYADCVHLDNELAVRSLLDVLKQFGSTRTAYLGWDNQEVFSVRERKVCWEKEAKRLTKSDCLELPWNQRENCEKNVRNILKRYEEQDIAFDSLLCGSGEIGIAAAKVLKKRGELRTKVVSVDEFPESGKYRISTYEQNFAESVKVIYECLMWQNTESEEWVAKCMGVKGALTRR